MICGRDSHVERDRSIVLWLSTSKASVSEDKLFLGTWCENCLDMVLEPPADRVEIYGLQESSVDWVPEWQLQHSKKLKSSRTSIRRNSKLHYCTLFVQNAQKICKMSFGVDTTVRILPFEICFDLDMLHELLCFKCFERLFWMTSTD